jgi:DNA-binding beta-propeller fold protein YncE
MTSPLGLAVNPATNKIYVALYFGPGIAVADGNTNQATIVTLSVLEPMAVAADPQTDRIYVTSYFGETVVLDGSNNQVVATVTTNGSDGAAVNVPLNRFYTCDFFHNQLNVVDGAAAKVLANVQVGAGPWAVAADPDNNRIYTANLNDGTVTVLEEQES